MEKLLIEFLQFARKTSVIDPEVFVNNEKMVALFLTECVANRFDADVRELKDFLDDYKCLSWSEDIPDGFLDKDGEIIITSEQKKQGYEESQRQLGTPYTYIDLDREEEFINGIIKIFKSA